MHEVFLHMYQTTRQVTLMGALDGEFLSILGCLGSFAAPRGAAEIQRASETNSLSNAIKMRKMVENLEWGIDKT